MLRLVVDDRVGLELHVAEGEGAADERLCVTPCAGQHVLLVGSRGMGHHAVPVEHRARLVAVEPPSDVEDGQIESAEVLLGEVQAVPVLVHRGVLEEVVEERHVAAHRVVLRDERPVPVHLLHVDPRGVGRLHVPPRSAVDPVQRPRHHPRAAVVGQLVHPAPGGGGRDHAFQRGRVLARRQPLVGAEVGQTGRAHVAAGPGLRRHPFDGVVAVLALLEEEAELAIGVAAPARVLDDDRVTTFREVGGPAGQAEGFDGHRLQVGRADDDGGEWTSFGRHPGIGGELDAVAHWCADIEHALDLGGLGGCRIARRSKGQEGAGGERQGEQS